MSAPASTTATPSGRGRLSSLPRVPTFRLLSPSTFLFVWDKLGGFSAAQPLHFVCAELGVLSDKAALFESCRVGDWSEALTSGARWGGAG